MAEKTITIRLSLKDGDTVRRALLALGDDGQRALARIESGAAPASRSLVAVNAVAQQAHGAMTAFGSRLGMVGTGLIALGPSGIAAAAGIAGVSIALAKAASAARDAARQLNDLEDRAKKVGVAVEPFQELEYAFGQNGVSAEKFAAGLAKLSDNLGDIAAGEGADARAAFEAIGVSVTRADGTLKSVGEILPEVADGLTRVTNQSQRLSIVNTLVGKGSADMVNLFQQGSVEIARLAGEAQKLGLVFDQAMIQRSAEVNNQLQTMEKVIDVQLKSAIVDLAPIVLEVVSAFAALARWVGEVVDGFKALETKSDAGLRRRLEDLQAALAGNAVERGALRPNDPEAKFLDRQAAPVEAEIRSIEEILARRERARHAAERPAAGGIQVKAPVNVSEAVKMLDLEHRSLLRLAEAHGLNDAAIRREETAQKAAIEVRRLKLDADSAEAETITDLITANEGLLRTIQRIQQARTVNEKFDSNAAYEHEIEILKELEATGQLSAHSLASAHEDAERRRLAGSREAADGIKRALLDLRAASTDFASQWEADIHAVNFTTRDFFVDLMTRTRDAGEALEAFGQRLLGIVAGRVYDRALGRFVDSALNSVFGPAKHAGGMVGAPGPMRELPAIAWAGAPRLHGGGWPLGRDEVPIVALRNERVLTAAQQENTARTLESLAAMAGRSPGVVVQPTVYLNAPGVSAKVRPSLSGNTLSLDVFVEQIEERMAGNVARGQGMAPILEGRYGLNPAAGAYR